MLRGLAKNMADEPASNAGMIELGKFVVELSRNMSTLTERIANVVDELKHNTSTTDVVAERLNDMRVETLKYQQRNLEVDQKINTLEKTVAAQKIEFVAEIASVKSQMDILDRKILGKVSVKVFSNGWTIGLGLASVIEALVILLNYFKPLH